MSQDPVQQQLIQKIKARRTDLNAFVTATEPRGARLTNVSIVCTAVASILTAGPALGGTTFTEGVQKMLGIASDASVWRVLCFGALILTVVATVATNLYKSGDMSERIAKAQASSALLAGLETSIEFGQLPTPEAIKLYQQYLADVPFVPEKM